MVNLKGVLGEDLRRKLCSDEGNRGDVGGFLDLVLRNFVCNIIVLLIGNVYLVILVYSLSFNYSLKKMLILLFFRNGKCVMW